MRAKRLLALSASPIVAVAALTLTPAAMPQAVAATTHAAVQVAAAAHSPTVIPVDARDRGFLQGQTDGRRDGSSGCFNEGVSRAPRETSTAYIGGYNAGYELGFRQFC